MVLGALKEIFNSLIKKARTNEEIAHVVNRAKEIFLYEMRERIATDRQGLKGRELDLLQAFEHGFLECQNDMENQSQNLPNIYRVDDVFKIENPKDAIRNFGKCLGFLIGALEFNLNFIIRHWSTYESYLKPLKTKKPEYFDFFVREARRLIPAKAEEIQKNIREANADTAHPKFKELNLKNLHDELRQLNDLIDLLSPYIGHISIG